MDYTRAPDKRCDKTRFGFCAFTFFPSYFVVRRKTLYYIIVRAKRRGTKTINNIISSISFLTSCRFTLMNPVDDEK